MTIKEFEAMILEDEDEPLTVDGKKFRTMREMREFIRHLYELWKEAN